MAVWQQALILGEEIYIPFKPLLDVAKDFVDPVYLLHTQIEFIDQSNIPLCCAFPHQVF